MNKAITVKPAESDGTNIMFVDHPVFKEKASKTFHFKNELAGNQPGVIKFYYLTDKGGSELPEFCKQMKDGATELALKAGPAVTPCTLSDGTSPGYYSYTIKYPDYEDLDPVIIIEPQMMLMALESSGTDPTSPGAGPMSFSVTALLATAAVAAVVGWFARRAFA